MAKTKLTGRKRDERITAYAFTAPAVILLIAFLVVPMIYPFTIPDLNIRL